MDRFECLQQELARRCPDLEVRAGEPMSRHTSFRIGGPARLMALPKSPAQAKTAVLAAREADIVPFFLGNGSNLLVPDEGVERFLIQPAGRYSADPLNRVWEENGQLCAGGGVSLAVLANAGSVDEVERAIRSGADGIGLFRSEFLYMQRQDGFPDEQVQTAAYARAAELCGGRPLVIRTLDIGGDKSLPYYRFPEEENPFLGWRAIRVSLELRDMFRTQLRAILRASARGGVRVMFPMIVSLAELRDALALLEECKEELRRQEVPFDDRIPVGVMIETPAAVFMADELAAEVDFFSIGTNDLTQYVLAVDRGNRRIAAMYDTLHPAVVRAMRLTVDAAHRHGCEVGICGEFAGCAAHAELLVGLGFDELSVAPPSVPAVKERIRGLETPQAELTARRAVEAATASEVHELIGVG